MGLLCLLEMGIWGDGYLMECAEDGIWSVWEIRKQIKNFFILGERRQQ